MIDIKQINGVSPLFYTLKYIVVDTETTGLLRDNPRMVSICWFVCDDKHEILKQSYHVIKPDGFTIPDSSIAVHRITNEEAIRTGTDIKVVLRKFAQDLSDCNLLVAHNVDFDKAIISSELERHSIPSKIHLIDSFCTMLKTTNICKEPKSWGSGYKWPKLEEMHSTLIGYKPVAHNAQSDTMMVKDCFAVLFQKGYFDINKIKKHAFENEINIINCRTDDFEYSTRNRQCSDFNRIHRDILRREFSEENLAIATNTKIQELSLPQKPVLNLPTQPQKDDYQLKQGILTKVFKKRAANKQQSLDEKYNTDIMLWESECANLEQQHKAALANHERKLVLYRQTIDNLQKQSDLEQKEWEARKLAYDNETQVLKEAFSKRKTAYSKKDSSAVTWYCKNVIDSLHSNYIKSESIEMEYTKETTILTAKVSLVDFEELQKIKKITDVNGDRVEVELHTETELINHHKRIIFLIGIDILHQLYLKNKEAVLTEILLICSGKTATDTYSATFKTNRESFVQHDFSQSYTQIKSNYTKSGNKYKLIYQLNVNPS